MRFCGFRTFLTPPSDIRNKHVKGTNTKKLKVTLVYSLYIKANKTARLSSRPPSRLSEYEKSIGVEGRITKGMS